MKAATLLVLAGLVLLCLGCSGGSSTGSNSGFDDIGNDADAQQSPGDQLSEDGIFSDLKQNDGGVDSVDLLPGDGQLIADGTGADSDAFPLSCNPGEGCFMDKCDRPESCISGWCIEHKGEGVCTSRCQEDCDPGWTCKQVSTGGSDFDSICVSNYPSLCKPCVSSADCQSISGEKIMCLDTGTNGHFCGGPCGVNDKCPSGYACADAVSVEGVSARQCVPISGTCKCTNKSIEYSLFTTCQSEPNQWGACEGKRVCKAEGLSDCDAPLAAAETCNGLDDDCDGQVDNSYLDGEVFVTLCDDGDPCTLDLCRGKDGCMNIPQTEKACDDNDACTQDDKCRQGICQGLPLECDDGNPCTDDFCEAGGCKTVMNSADCDDKDPCTGDDKCTEGVCKGVGVPCGCASNADCDALGTGNACTGFLKCDKTVTPARCVLDESTAKTCPAPAGPNAECLAAFCSPSNGNCGFVPAREGLFCDDLDKCDDGDVCTGGICGGGKPIVCNDANPCTTDECVPASGCSFKPLDAVCNDNNPCTENDRCANGVCSGGTVRDCDDGNTCTKDSCDAQVGCVNQKIGGIPCDDKNKCTSGETCAVGVCGGGAPLICDDKNPCTKDYCSPELGCQTLNEDGVLCDDKNPCTSKDVCSSGVCKGNEPVVCNDNNVCTTDICNSVYGCVYNPASGPCADGNRCTTGDICVNGTCAAGSPVVCDDKQPCTDDYCDPQNGCMTKPGTGGACDDGNPCTFDDVCASGTCTGGGLRTCPDDTNPCTKATCDPRSGCIQVNTEGTCDDGNKCTPTDTCVSGACVGSGTVTCPEDTNPCTDATCVPATGCGQVNNTKACEDGNKCTSGDICAAGACKSGTAVVCPDDGNICTGESCSPSLGCITSNLDGGKCGTNPNEYCKGGKCTCIPNCTGKTCGDDGCGGVCGPCTANPLCATASCATGTCVVTISQYFCMINDECIPSGAEDPTDSCRLCKPAISKTAWTTKDDLTKCGLTVSEVCWKGTCCNPVPNCAGKQCGDNGCGGTCGTCGAALPICEEGICVHASATLPYSTGFETGAFDAYWASGAATGGRVQIVSTNGPKEGLYSVQLDKNPASAAGTYLNKADLYLNLKGETSVYLEFWWKEFVDETDVDDGVYLSVDNGATFTQLFQLKDGGMQGATPVWNHSTANLARMAAAKNLTFTSKSILRFQVRSVGSIATDGMAFDAISLTRTTSLLYRGLPYSETFPQPVLSAGVAAYTSRSGRVRVIDTFNTTGDYAAVMDSTQASGNRGESEVDIYLNLSGASKVSLRYSLMDWHEGADAWDGVWISDNGGATFAKVAIWNPGGMTDGVWYSQSIDLDAMALANGLTLTDQFVVSFRQSSDNAATAKGVQIDNIKAFVSTYNSAFPYYTGFETVNGELDANWSCTSTANGRCLVGTANAPYAGTRHLYMDASGAPVSVNSAMLRLNLSGTTAKMTFQAWIKGFNEEVGTTEGAYISADGGANFSKVRTYIGGASLSNNYTLFSFNITDEATFYGLNSKSPTFVIMIRQSGERHIPDDGLAMDEVRVQ